MKRRRAEERREKRVLIFKVRHVTTRDHENDVHPTHAAAVRWKRARKAIPYAIHLEERLKDKKGL